MKTSLLRFCFLFALFAAPLAQAAKYVHAPITFSGSFTTNRDFIEGGNYIEVKPTTAKYTNADLLKYYRKKGLIPSTSGWSIYCYLDSAFGDDPPLKFELRHKSGKRVSLAKEIKAKLISSTGKGRVTVSSSAKLSGTLTLSGFYRFTVAFQGYTATFYGDVEIPFKVTGDEKAQYVTPRKIAGSLVGYVDDETRGKLTISAGAFEKR